MSLEHFCCLVAFCIGENPNSKLFVYQGHGFWSLFSRAVNVYCAGAAKESA
jgi:hypothetical protein